MENLSILIKESKSTTNIFDPNKTDKNKFLMNLKKRINNL
jgi:hypothetical protein